jgi:ribosome-associated protein
VKSLRRLILPVSVVAWRMTSEDEAESGEYQGGRPSKSARKREANSRQDLGVELAALPESELDTLDLPEPLRVALRDLRRLPSHGAQFRQRQYIGKLMRRIDPEPVIAKLAQRKVNHDAEVRRFQSIERWRDRLLAEPAALEELLAEHPAADRQRLSQLLRKSGEAQGVAAGRELFVYLRSVFQ